MYKVCVRIPLDFMLNSILGERHVDRSVLVPMEKVCGKSALFVCPATDQPGVERMHTNS